MTSSKGHTIPCAIPYNFPIRHALPETLNIQDRYVSPGFVWPEVCFASKGKIWKGSNSEKGKLLGVRRYRPNVLPEKRTPAK